MKRFAADAGFPAEGQVVRVTVHVPADRCTWNEPMTIPLICHNSGNADAVKKILAYRIRAMPTCTMLSVASEWPTYSVYRADHSFDHPGHSAFRAGCSLLQGRK